MVTARSPHPKQTLSELGLTAKKSFGQNFLTDLRIAQEIARLAAPEPATSVVELGAGLGALTGPLLERAARVIAVERDRDLIEPLAAAFSAAVAAGTLSILEADAKRVDLAALLSGAGGSRSVAGNLPYQLSGPLLRLCIDQSGAADRFVFLLQREVVDRLVAAPGEPDYGALSVFCQARFEARRAVNVSRGAFYPVPKVDSAVVVLSPRAQPLARETAAFQRVVKLAFAQRRKQLRNAWRSLGVESEQLAQAADRAGIDLGARGETLAVEDFARMALELGA